MINNKGELLFPESEFGKRSEARNRLLVDLLVRTEFMEKAGTGIKRIRDACKDNRNICNFNFSDAFWIEIYSNFIKEEKTENFTEKVPDRVPDDKNINSKKIYEEIKKNDRVSMADLSKTIGISKRKILDNINKLKDMKLIERVGNNKTGRWRIIN